MFKNGGCCAVGRISAIIRQELPGRYWQAGGPFTYHRLQETFKQWEARGWLTPAGLDTGRMVTPELRRLVGVRGVGIAAKASPSNSSNSPNSGE